MGTSWIFTELLIGTKERISANLAICVPARGNFGDEARSGGVVCYSAVSREITAGDRFGASLPNSAPKCLLEVFRRDATQIKHRQKHIEAPRSPRPQRQDRRGETDPLAVAGSPAIPNLHPGNLDSTDPRLDRAFGTMTVPDNTVPTISKLEVLHGGEKRLRFQLDRLREQLSRTGSQDIRYGSSISSGVTKACQHC